MSTNFEKISSNKVKLTFVVPAEDFDKALNQAYLKDRSKINVPGFRKGKAPRAVIERMYGEGVFYDDALDAIFPALYAEAIKEHNIDVVDRPQVDVQEIGAGKELKFTAEVFVRPDVTLGEYKNLAVEVEPKEVVTEDEIQARISPGSAEGRAYHRRDRPRRGLHRHREPRLRGQCGRRSVRGRHGAGSDPENRQRRVHPGL